MSIAYHLCTNGDTLRDEKDFMASIPQRIKTDYQQGNPQPDFSNDNPCDEKLEIVSR
jgi:hypothetical protein